MRESPPATDIPATTFKNNASKKSPPNIPLDVSVDDPKTKDLRISRDSNTEENKFEADISTATQESSEMTKSNKGIKSVAQKPEISQGK